MNTTINNYNKQFICKEKQQLFDLLRSGNKVSITYYLEKNKQQIFSGTLVSKERKGLATSITLLDEIKKIKVLKKFLIFNPSVVSFQVVKPSQARQGKLYRLFAD